MINDKYELIRGIEKVIANTKTKDLKELEENLITIIKVDIRKEIELRELINNNNI